MLITKLVSSCPAVVVPNGGTHTLTSCPAHSLHLPPSLPPLQLYPPSGVLPHQGLATLAAPLCYVYEHPVLVYRMFVALYCRYWCR